MAMSFVTTLDIVKSIQGCFIVQSFVLYLIYNLRDFGHGVFILYYKFSRWGPKASIRVNYCLKILLVRVSERLCEGL